MREWIVTFYSILLGVQDLLAALISVYPPEREHVVRSGSLPGEPTKGIPTATSAEKQVVRQSSLITSCMQPATRCLCMGSQMQHSILCNVQLQHTLA
jgi:hypothetical protein